jgi:hypothetical protein
VRLEAVVSWEKTIRKYQKNIRELAGLSWDDAIKDKSAALKRGQSSDYLIYIYINMVVECRNTGTFVKKELRKRRFCGNGSLQW